MSLIKQLTSEIISLIAAGEVIERPAYIVKELIENALDAKATQIDIELTQGSLESIQVTDNGVGMEKEDLLLSFKLHTTSKLYDDLYSIHTLGFRGEALASIASIADITIESRTESSPLGNFATLLNGNVIDTGTVGMSVGTKVFVNNIFSNTPARKSFLSTPLTEYRRVLDLVASYIFSSPHVSFKLINNGEVIVDSRPSDDLPSKAETFLGEADQFIPFKAEDGYILLSGMLSRPQMQSRSNKKMFFSVNGRAIMSPLLTQAVKDAYGSLIEPKTYPPVVLSLSVPYERVLVNIHPRKEEVKFLESELIYQIVKSTIAEELKSHNLTFFNISSWKKSETRSPIAKELKEEVLGKPTTEGPHETLQVHNLYLITQTDQGILILDQHAAHERVLFEQFKTAYESKKSEKKTSKLATPLLLNVTLQEIQTYKEHEDFFNQSGFEIEEFGDLTLKVTSVPFVLEKRDVKAYILEVLADIVEGKIPSDIDSMTYLLLSYLACRSAIKGGETLEKEKIQELMDSLMKLDMAYTCPHGRPLKVELTVSELNRMFKRH